MNIAKKEVTETSIIFRWADDSEPTVIMFEDFSNEIRQDAMRHGFKQKLGDAYSGCSTMIMAKVEFQAVLDTLTEGDWNRKGVATGGLWIAAIAQVTGETVEEVLEKWQAMDDDTRKDVKKHPDVIVAHKTIELARAKAKAEDAPALTI